MFSICIFFLCTSYQKIKLKITFFWFELLMQIKWCSVRFTLKVLVFTQSQYNGRITTMGRTHVQWAFWLQKDVCSPSDPQSDDHVYYQTLPHQITMQRPCFLQLDILFLLETQILNRSFYQVKTKAILSRRGSVFTNFKCSLHFYCTQISFHLVSTSFVHGWFFTCSVTFHKTVAWREGGSCLA